MPPVRSTWWATAWSSLQNQNNFRDKIHIVPESNDPVATTITTPHVLESIASSFLNSFSGQVVHLIEI